MALNDNALVSISDLRAYLTRANTDATDGRLTDALLTDLIHRVTAAIEAHCGRQLMAPATAQTYVLDHDGTYTVVAPEYPIVAVTSLTDLATGAVIAARTTVGGIGYVLSASGGLITIYGDGLTAGEQTVQLVARLGYDATTAALSTQIGRLHRAAIDTLRQAALMWCFAIFTTPNPSAETMSVEGLNLTVRPERLPTPVQQLLAPYRRVPVW